MLTSTTQVSGTTLRATPPWTVTAETTSRNVKPANAWSTGATSASAAIPRPARWIALSASHGRALWPAVPRNVHVALMLPTQPACRALSVGSITTTRSASVRPGSRSSSGVSALSPNGSSSRPKKTKPTSTVAAAGGASASSIITPSAAFMSAAPRPWTAPSAIRPGRLSWAGIVSRWPASSTSGRSPRRVAPASTHVSPASRRPPGAPASRPSTCAASGPSPPDSDGTSTSSRTREARRSASASDDMGRHAIAAARGIASTRVRYCGVDISAKPANQQLVTLHERRGADGTELVATFYEPGSADDVARTVLGFGGEAAVAIDAPSGPRLDLLAPGMPLRATLGLPAGRYERMRVCDALLYRRRLPLYPVPAAEQALTRWQGWMQQGFELFAALDALELFRPDAAQGRVLEGPVGEGALRLGRVAETYPDAVFCALLGHRPPAKRTPSGLQQRIAVLKLRGVVDDDGGLWQRTTDELDACAAAYAAYTLATGTGGWVGDPREGVIVLPVARLADRYDRLPVPARTPLLVSASRRPPSST